LGRGGSDTTAVALAAALKADVCEIYSDVDGIYTADPRVVSTAQKLDVIDIESMLELAAAGAKILHIRAVEFARRHKVDLRVRSTFSNDPGTKVISNEDGVNQMEESIVSGVATDKGKPSTKAARWASVDSYCATALTHWCRHLRVKPPPKATYLLHSPCV
jgi:aspartate kinase